MTADLRSRLAWCRRRAKTTRFDGIFERRPDRLHDGALETRRSQPVGGNASRFDGVLEGQLRVAFFDAGQASSVDR
jgi:hypothetical protein